MTPAPRQPDPEPPCPLSWEARPPCHAYITSHRCRRAPNHDGRCECPCGATTAKGRDRP